MEETRIKHFLKELEYLTEKYQIKIWGCSCCGSPALHDIKDDKTLITCLEYDENDKIYNYFK